MKRVRILQPPSVHPIHVLAVYDSTHPRSHVKCRSENDRENFQGVFDIYGTSSVYPTLYLPVGEVLLVAALGLEIYYKKAVAK